MINYDRSKVEIGILHFGLGGFHRAHQAVFADLAIEKGNNELGIASISQRDPSLADEMSSADSIYEIEASDGNKRTLLSELYGQLKLGRQKIEKFIRRIYGHRMYVAVKRVNVRENGKKTTELVILVSPQEFSCDPFIQYRQLSLIHI